ncbi:MAG: PAS domain S-box protein [Chloroflexi bacterium]|nr:PAS domain S-box protein [Chloroflexota bacterium]
MSSADKSQPAKRPRRRPPTREAEQPDTIGGGSTATARRLRFAAVQPASETEIHRLVAENVADIICVLDLNLRVIYLSPSVTRLLGYSVEEALGQYWDQWIDVALTPECAAIASKAFRDMVASLDRGPEDVFKSWTTELEFLRSDGSTLWTESKVTVPRTPEGRPIGFIGIVRDISERKRTEEALKHSESQLRLLSQRIIEVQEEERSRIARELHDQLGQELVALKIELVSLAERLAGVPPLRDRARSMLDMVESLDATSHRIAVSLRPEILDELGLVKAIQWYAEDFERRSGISCPVEAPLDEPVLGRQTATCAYRIVQEALTNVWKHSGASQARIRITTSDNTVTVSVSDNGVGLDFKRLPDTPSLGLLGMRERASLAGGKVSIRRNRGKGLRVLANLPMNTTDTRATAAAQ